ncbi:hypothetical protein FRC03_009623 [Tulasnella sp. 419]|nr:hypothetical protein FRC03_009623 [Tulasnella sp. 419]
MSSKTATEQTALDVFEGKPVFSCAKCATTIVSDYPPDPWNLLGGGFMHLCEKALQDELISKSFSGREGRAYLLHSTVNIKLGKKEDRELLTGRHTVADIKCVGCDTSVGWTYLKAHEASQRYKEGKFIIEKERVVRDNNWSVDDDDDENSD